MRVTLQQINNERVEPMVLPPEKRGKKKVLGAALFSDPFSNVFICAKKKSGKSTTIGHIVKRTVGPDTTVIFFVSTLYRDANYRSILKLLEKRGIHVIKYTSLIEDGQNQLNVFLDHLEAESKEEELERESNHGKSKKKKA